MNFIKKLNHLQLLKLALGISIFSIGYLIAMFYFQMQDLKEYKKRIVLFNSASIALLHLESAIEKDSYYTQSSLLNHTIFTKNTNSENDYLLHFFKKHAFLDTIDDVFLEKNNKLKTLLYEYHLSKKQILNEKSIGNINVFNSAVYHLLRNINSNSDYLETKIKVYNQNYDSMIDDSKSSGFLIALFSLVIFVLAYVKMNGDIDNLKKVNDEISFINETLNNAEMVAGFGSWKLNTETGVLRLSENFFRLIEQETNTLIPSFENIIQFIHPDDREHVIKEHQESLKELKDSKIIYRYLLPSGKIKNIISVGKFLLNNKKQLVKIGVTYDITEIIKKTQDLEEYNTKLIAINSELESFNNIVSHDLQEPLRKIQMFISRIENKDFLTKSSETTLSYFEKIKLAAQRMQNLMTDLVNYTKTIKKGDRVFEEIDLNAVFDEIKEDLAILIEEKKALITIQEMPIILGTRFQIQQLFINLISNAIKYVKPGIRPIVNVELKKFTTDVINDKIIDNKDFHKISITDNGIGFEQKYADKIFMLFKRLETDENYIGTGLGLAICKKIVENHNGYIIAQGIPNNGSVFTIYLPK